MKNLIILSIFTILTSGTCRKESATCHRKITLINKSSNSIFVHGGSYYPDTLIGNEFPNPLNQPQQFEVLPTTENTEALKTRGDCYESLFTSQFASGKIMIFVFDKTILQNNQWDTIKKYCMYLKRYDLSQQDLQNNNWTITYP